jgi:hypothetical protein
MIQCCSLHGVILLLSEMFSEFHEERPNAAFYGVVSRCGLELIHHEEIHRDVYNYAKTFKYHHASLKPSYIPSVVFSGLLAWFSSAAELGHAGPIMASQFGSFSGRLERVYTSPDKKNA